jgi:membrane-associated phospholipid phosphatase
VTGPAYGLDDGSGPTDRSGLLGAVDTVDERVDALFEPFRGRPSIDTAAKAITAIGDHGWLWTGVAMWRGRRSGPKRRAAIRALGVAGVSSTIVNTGIKQVVGRERPDRTDLRISNTGVPVREPKTSSFPSGHTLAAFCTAFVLGDSEAGTAANVGFAAAVAASRVHLRAHHPTDVIGGAVIGSVLGLGLRPIVDVVTPGSGGRRGRRRRSGRGMRQAEVVL